MLSTKNQNNAKDKFGNFLLLGMGKPIFDAFCKMGLPPKIWVKTGRKLGFEQVNLTTVYDYSPIKFAQVDAHYSRDLDPKLADIIRRDAMPIYLRNINRIERNPKERARTWVSYNNNFEIMLHWYYELITSHNIRTIVFDNTPHGGSNIALYFLAKHLGLQIVIPYQTLFGENFILLSDYEDVGLYKTSFRGKKRQNIAVNPEPVPPFYSRKPDTKFKVIGMLIEAYIDYYYKIISQFTFDKNVLRPKKRRISIMKEKYNFLHVLKQSKTSVDMNRDFIYFPLHFQPEMNADVLGGKYSDQLLAIEELRRLVPENICIYVKENPHQTAYAREESFYKRLNSLPNVSYLSPKINTFDLIKNSKAVAAITGTAGWEALQMGKPVICFGFAWYRSLPGVFDWLGNPDWGDVVNFNYNEKKLKTALKDLSLYFHKGISNPKGYSDVVPGFDAELNGENVAQSISDYVIQLSEEV